MNHRKREYTLREIAGWTKESEVKIPDLQRGLVWKPRQMELLWDSMMRGFPVGSFILSDAADGTFYLLDGQQRYNAIATGFASSVTSHAMLWIDIHPNIAKNSTRTFLIKSTTMAHPWGFKNNDDCSPLSSAERRSALKEFGFPRLNIYRDTFYLNKTWPVEASKPVPLHFFLEAPLETPEAFVDYIRAKCAERGGLPYSDLDENDIVAITKIYPAFRELDSYTIQCDVLPRDVIERESEGKEGAEEASPMEVLFNRLNTGGTRISQEDLNYSAIKSYWGSIRKRNDDIAKLYMSPAKLVMLVFRLALTRIDRTRGLRAPLSIRQIRSCATDLIIKEQIELLYDRLGDIMGRIDAWLSVSNDPEGTPAYLRTSIARKSPDVFLLLMYLASEDLDGKMRISPTEAKGLAFLLHWLARDQQKAAGTIFKYIRDGGDSTSLRQGISESIGMNYLLPVYSPEEMSSFFQISPGPRWNPWTGKDYAPWFDFYLRVSWWGNFQAQEMLLFAQRAFINAWFPRFDPAREDLWEDYNRPWDYDHIIPQNAIRYKRGQFKDYCEHWLFRIGNIAAIPFEDNRSKGDRNDGDSYSVYATNADQLLFYPDFLELSQLGTRLSQSPEGSLHFAELSFKRTIDIYSRSYELFSSLFETVSLTDRQKRRRQCMEFLASHLNGSEIVYVARGGDLWRDYPRKREADWSSEWLSVGVRRNDKFFVALSWGCNDQDHLEIGARKLPETDIMKDNSGLPDLDNTYWTGVGDWWYAEKGLPSNMKQETILEELQELLKRFGDD